MIKKMIMGALAIGLFASSCSNDDDTPDFIPTPSPTTSDLTIDFSGLETLGPDFVYEGWIIVDGNPVSTGIFSSVTFPQTYQVDTEQLAAATKFVLTIEPAGETGADALMPSATKILAGMFSGDTADVNSNNTIVDATGTVTDFTAATGTYILATPTDGMANNERSGVWFLDNSSGSAVAGLNLPTLQPGWKYEGWAVIDGTPVSTGTFTDPAMADDNASTSPYKGDMGDGPGYPGEDYIQNAPSGLTFPTDLRGKTIVLTVEPSPDNSGMPFTFKPLAHMVPADAEDHTAIVMGEGPLQSLSGSAMR